MEWDKFFKDLNIRSDKINSRSDGEESASNRSAFAQTSKAGRVSRPQSPTICAGQAHREEDRPVQKK